ncbi:hypothetical protein EMCRGX_G029257 [Ephydatia muelleri]
MVKTLRDCCLASIARNISTISRLGTFLSVRDKEILLERLCWHGLLTTQSIPYVTYHLFSDTLQRVNLSYCNQVDDKLLEVLSQSGCRPKHVTVHDCPNVTNRGVICLSKILWDVEELKLRRLKHITSEGIQSIASKGLKYLNLRRCDGITDDGLIAVIRNCPNIERLNVCRLHKLTDVSIVYVAETLGSKLVELDARELTLITSKSTMAIGDYCSNLTRAVFESCVRLEGDGLIHITTHCPLAYLDLSLCYKVGKEDMTNVVASIKARNSLQHFVCIGGTVSTVCIEVLSSTPSLTHLCLCGIQELSDEMIGMITQLAGRHLVELDVSNCLQLTDLSCSSIADHCQRLEVLGLMHLGEVRGTELSRLFLDKRAKKLKSVSLSGTTNLPISVIRTLVENCPNLEVLNLAGMKTLTDEIAFSVAAHCPNLKQVCFRNSKLTDLGVCQIAIHCPNLVMVGLAGIHDLTDKCIMALAENCPYLDEVYLSGCAKITKQAVTYLVDCAIYWLYVNHTTPNAPFGLLMAKDLDKGEYTRVDDLPLEPLVGRTNSMQLP